MRWSGLCAAINRRKTAPGEPRQSIIVIVMVVVVVIVIVVVPMPGADVARGSVDVTAHVLRFLRIGADGPRFDDRKGRRGNGRNVDPARRNVPLDPRRQRVVELRGPIRYAVSASNAGQRRIGIRIG